MTDPLECQKYRLILGDALERLRELPDGFVQTCVTSPPYWNLRDYQTATWEGADPDCDHVARTVESMASKNTLGPTGSLPKTNAAFRGRQPTYRDRCGKCGAVRVDRQIGLEDTPDAYIARLVAVFREVKRVLRPDGTLWLNLADGMTGKNLQGIPWRVAFALQADAWVLRSEITWCKLAPMPESVTDRPTSATEKLFLFSKSPSYFYDQDAVRVPASRDYSGEGWANVVGKQGNKENSAVMRHNGSKTWADCMNPAGRNLWNYWVLPPESTPYRHYACMPTRLVEPCVLAGSSQRGGCSACGAPWTREVERTLSTSARENWKAQGQEFRHGSDRCGGFFDARTVTTGWSPSCACDADPIPNVILDPFCGTATVGEVALAMGRRFLGIDLSADYLDIARQRCETLPSYTGAKRVVTLNAGQLSLTWPLWGPEEAE